MRIRTILVVAALYAVPACGQAPKQIVQCRALRPGDVLGPTESLVGSGDNAQVCSVVVVKPAATTPAPIVDQPATAGPAVAASQTVAQPVAASTWQRNDSPMHHQCLILKRMGPADQITSHMYSFGIRGKQFQYVEGDFPAGVKFHGRLTDHDVRNIQSHGGKVVMMEPKYSADDLREAKLSCKDE